MLRTKILTIIAGLALSSPLLAMETEPSKARALVQFTDKTRAILAADNPLQIGLDFAVVDPQALLLPAKTLADFQTLTDQSTFDLASDRFEISAGTVPPAVFMRIYAQLQKIAATDDLFKRAEVLTPFFNKLTFSELVQELYAIEYLNIRERTADPLHGFIYSAIRRFFSKATYLPNHNEFSIVTADGIRIPWGNEEVVVSKDIQRKLLLILQNVISVNPGISTIPFRPFDTLKFNRKDQVGVDIADKFGFCVLERCPTFTIGDHGIYLAPGLGRTDDDARTEFADATRALKEYAGNSELQYRFYRRELYAAGLSANREHLYVTFAENEFGTISTRLAIYEIQPQRQSIELIYEDECIPDIRPQFAPDGSYVLFGYAKENRTSIVAEPSLRLKVRFLKNQPEQVGQAQALLLKVRLSIGKYDLDYVYVDFSPTGAYFAVITGCWESQSAGASIAAPMTNGKYRIKPKGPIRLPFYREPDGWPRAVTTALRDNGQLYLLESRVENARIWLLSPIDEGLLTQKSIDKDCLFTGANHGPCVASDSKDNTASVLLFNKPDHLADDATLFSVLQERGFLPAADEQP